MTGMEDREKVYLCYPCGLSIKQMDLSRLTEWHARMVHDFVKAAGGVRVTRSIQKGRYICDCCGGKEVRTLLTYVRKVPPKPEPREGGSGKPMRTISKVR